MIRRAANGEFLLITQDDHALLSGVLAEAFGNAEFAAPQPLDSVLRAVRMHDCGWPLHDDAPTLNSAGLPLDVFESTREIAIRVWTASVERTAAEHPYAGLLVSLHVLSLSVLVTTQNPFENTPWDMDNAPDRFAVTKFQHKEIERQQQLRQKLGLRADRPIHHDPAKEVTQKSEDQLTFNFRLLQAMDLISLAACCTKPPVAQTQDLFFRQGGSAARLKLERHGNDLHISPWPFNSSVVELQIPATRITAVPFEEVDAFRAVYASAPAEIIRCRVLPGASA